jgi:hypothetical protein
LAILVGHRLDDGTNLSSELPGHLDAAMSENNLIAAGNGGMRTHQYGRVLAPLLHGNKQFLKSLVVVIDPVRYEGAVDEFRVEFDNTAFGEFFEGTLDRTRSAADDIGQCVIALRSCWRRAHHAAENVFTGHLSAPVSD